MGLTRYKLGELIEQSNLRNKDKNNIYIEKDVQGISTNKDFIETKANLKNVSLGNYKIVDSKEFAYVSDTSRRGDKISLAFNLNDYSIIVSSISTVFKVKKTNLLNPYYLYMYFNREEFDRFSRYNSWGTARETFTWEDLCDIEIELPPLDIQEKYVAIYKAMEANQKSYEKGLEDLKLVCDGTIDKIKKNYNKQYLGEYITETNQINTDKKIKKVLGVESSGSFMDTKANMKGVNTAKYSVINKYDFAYNPSRINIGSIAMYRNSTPCIVSPMYQTFNIINNEDLIPEYLNLWFTRSEFHRYTWYFSTGSVRDLFDLNLMKQVKIPIPPRKTQESIANIYKVYTERKEINEKLKENLKNICPILIKGSREEALRKE